jgi:hypothetical protein
MGASPIFLPSPLPPFTGWLRGRGSGGSVAPIGADIEPAAVQTRVRWQARSVEWAAHGPTRFDSLVRAVGTAVSRRGALAALLAGLVAPLLPDAEGSAKRRRNGVGNDQRKRKPSDSRTGRDSRQRDGRQDQGKVRKRSRSQIPRAGAEAAKCCSSGHCTPGAGKNLGTCCYAGRNLAGKSFKGANLGNANFSRANLTRANLAGANLNKTCLVDANLTGATINGSTNLAGAVFCRATMPDGSRNTSGCARAMACCETCNVAVGGSCAGSGDVCGGGAECQGGVCACPAGETDCDGVCQGCCADDQCPSDLCCNGSCCEVGEVCDTRDNPDACCTPITTCPEDKTCGSIADGCGGRIVCGSCPDEAPICVGNVCRGCASNEECGAANRGNLCCGGACFDGDCRGDEVCSNPRPLCVDHTCIACNGQGQCVPCSGGGTPTTAT